MGFKLAWMSSPAKDSQSMKDSQSVYRSISFSFVFILINFSCEVGVVVGLITSRGMPASDWRSAHNYFTTQARAQVPS